MKINDDFIKNEIGDEVVLVPVGEKYQNGIFTLNESAERIYDLLSEGKSREEIVAVLCKEYDTKPSQVTAFADDFMAKLREFGILTDD